MINLLQKFQSYIRQQNLFEPGDRLLLTVSGGVDSVSLCELCNQAGYSFAIAHCNFKLRGEESESDERFVKQLAEKYEVPFFTKSFDTKVLAASARQSIETAARELRYQWFYEILEKQTDNPFKYIVTGHHADDNIETVLMNFFRGTGITGLRGMLTKQLKIVRPLLFARRSDLEAFVTLNNLLFVTDRTNLENDFTRNYFRNSVIPFIKKTYPEAETNVLKNIHRLAEANILYEQAVTLQKSKLLEIKGNEIHIPVLKLMKAVPLSTILYEIIKEFGFTAHQADEAMALLKSDSGRYIKSASHRIIRNRNWLIIAPLQSVSCNHILIEAKDEMVMFDGGSIKIERLTNKQLSFNTEVDVAILNAAEIKFPMLLRRWKQGDYFYPLGMQKKKKLSRFFIDQKLSAIQKEKVWVVETDKKIIWIAGIRIDDRFKITPSTTEVLKLIYSTSGN